MDFSKFDKEINVKQLTADIAEAQKNGGGSQSVPAGTYEAILEKLELGETKDHRPMVRGQFRIVSGEYKKFCLFYNRVIYGTKNDANMIASVIGFLLSLEPSEDVGDIAFRSYSSFADLLLDIAEDCAELTYTIDYDPDKFQAISVQSVEE